MLYAVLSESRLRALLLFGLLAALAVPGTVFAQGGAADAISTPLHYPSAPGILFIPPSNQQQPLKQGQKFVAHTNIEVFVPSGLEPDEEPPYPGYGYETPASIACHYGLVSTGQYPNCNPNLTTVNPTGGSNSIAVVDAYDDPSAPGDLAWFSLQFGLPLKSKQFQVVWANPISSTCFGGTVPIDYTGGWEIEEATDIEWAHAMAPNATLYLVEACSPLDYDLKAAVLVASNLVQCGQTEIDPNTGVLGTCPKNSTGKGEVSMSWGGNEFVGENGSDGCAILDDSCFTTPYVVYFASSGDSPGVSWPGTSVNAVSAGGTTIRRNALSFNFIQEAAWTFTGGGQSAIEPIPNYQSSIAGIVGKWRGVPDWSFDADPYTGVYVYDTFPIQGFEYLEWLIVGGTSVSAPSLAGIENASGIFHSSSNLQLQVIYANKGITADFTDIQAGFCGNYMGFTAGSGWDFCTGVGVDNSYKGK